MVTIPLTAPSSSQPRRLVADAAAGAGGGAELEPLVVPFKILYDRQERAGGWRFSGLIGNSGDKYRPLIVPTVEQHLKTADYSIEDCPVFIERKSVEDFLSTIIHGRERFEREHERMREIEAVGGNCLVIIEGNLDQIIESLERHDSMRKIHPNSVRGSVAAFGLSYGIPWLFAGSRRAAEEMAFTVMRKAWERMQEANKKKK